MSQRASPCQQLSRICLLLRTEVQQSHQNRREGFTWPKFKPGTSTSHSQVRGTWVRSQPCRRSPRALGWVPVGSRPPEHRADGERDPVSLQRGRVLMTKGRSLSSGCSSELFELSPENRHLLPLNWMIRSVRRRSTTESLPQQQPCRGAPDVPLPGKASAGTKQARQKRAEL